MKVTAVELTDLADSDSKEEQDTATAVDNICYEKVLSKLNVLHLPAIRYHVFVKEGYEGRDLPHSQPSALQVLGGVNIIYDTKWQNHSLYCKVLTSCSGRD